MHPAFSVIVFTTLSGAGYGLWFWLALDLLMEVDRATSAALQVAGLLLGLLLVTVGLLSSLAHLGQPQRAWRALSQWRSSWLSREGVLALLTYVPMLLLLAWLVLDWSLSPLVIRGVLLVLAVGSLLTVACTAMIYASLKPIPAWRHRLVLPIYLGFALLTGGLLAAALDSYSAQALATAMVSVLTLTLLGLAALKLAYWRDIDQQDASGWRASAVGLPAGSRVRSWEAPHTEANYLNREMGYVLARRHARPLRLLAMSLFAALPLVLLLSAWLLPGWQTLLLAAAAVTCLAGAMVERWLFFAQAKHLVNLYYG